MNSHLGKSPKLTAHSDGTNRQDWTPKEIEAMRRIAHLGATAVATELRRTVFSVKKCAYRNRISLRKRGERRGLMLGQPLKGGAELAAAGRLVALMHRIREAALSGQVDMTRVETRIRADVRDEPPLCPVCGRNPQRRQTGLCDACHHDRLTEQLREEAAHLNALREHNAAKQQLKRARDRLAAEVEEADAS